MPTSQLDPTKDRERCHQRPPIRLDRSSSKPSALSSSHAMLPRYGSCQSIEHMPTDGLPPKDYPKIIYIHRKETDPASTRSFKLTNDSPASKKRSDRKAEPLWQPVACFSLPESSNCEPKKRTKTTTTTTTTTSSSSSSTATTTTMLKSPIITTVTETEPTLFHLPRPSALVGSRSHEVIVELVQDAESLPEVGADSVDSAGSEAGSSESRRDVAKSTKAPREAGSGLLAIRSCDSRSRQVEECRCSCRNRIVCLEEEVVKLRQQVASMAKILLTSSYQPAENGFLRADWRLNGSGSAASLNSPVGECRRRGLMTWPPGTRYSRAHADCQLSHFLIAQFSLPCSYPGCVKFPNFGASRCAYWALC
ncbi:unnamed protein product [Protopolystoma xenopodis]|uniref:Uncharacterized protein n=1 Tax=Protopolystoma xenopodis TaxID=117903 RepID=A0A3S5CLG6_9PLAT|nr:unnamed protein product [Protopolystoma xenopodis]